MKENNEQKKEHQARLAWIKRLQQLRAAAAKKALKQIFVSFSLWALVFTYWWMFPLVRFSESFEARAENNGRVMIWLAILAGAVFFTNRWVVREFGRRDVDRHMMQFAVCAASSTGILLLLEHINPSLLMQVYPHSDYVDMLLLAGLLIGLAVELNIVVRAFRRNH